MVELHARFLGGSIFRGAVLGYRMFVYIIDHIYFTNNGSTKISQTKINKSRPT